MIGALEKLGDQSKTMSYFGTEKRQQLDMVANSYFTETLKTTVQRLHSAEVMNDTIVQYQASVPKFAWPGWLFGGPEYQRLAARYSLPQYFWLYIVLQLSLPGCPVFYYGDELGLKNFQVEAMAWDNKANGGKLSVSLSTSINNITLQNNMNSIVFGFVCSVQIQFMGYSRLS